jgi:UDPglucose--hexose-1-phosphate uridylyltransferase
MALQHEKDMHEQDTAHLLARLVQFGLQQGMLEELDRIPVTNALIDLFGVDAPYEGEVPDERLDSAVPVLEPLLDEAARRGLIPENTMVQRDLFDARIMGLLMPRESEVVRSFRRTTEEKGIREATDAFYRLSVASNYIRMDRVSKNEYWLAATEFGELEITINLSKPEKDPRDIAAEKAAPQLHYPKCLLCLENVGYAGRVNHPARQNHRVIPLTLDGAPWYLQYSPYVYYNEHSIIFSEAHMPMKISRDSFVRLLDFVRQFPHYFIGSNADLPIVGGSILSHDHFQGGRHVFPMEKAPVESRFRHAEFTDVKAGIVKWPMSVVRISGNDPDRLIELADRLLAGWRAYCDESADVLAFSEQNGARTPHNTITPIARRNASGEYELDLVLRNNRTTAEHPLGLFHPHAELHHIKKENIGLIEVMGLAVLPGRLKQELEQLQGYLTGDRSGGAEELNDPTHPLHAHAAWIRQLTEEHGTGMSSPEASELLRTEVGRKFMQVLTDAGVFKRNDEGQRAFRRFMQSMNFLEVLE